MTADLVPAVRAAIADFPFAGYGINLDGADPAWVGDLAATIAGALPDTGSNGQPTQGFFQPGHGYTHRDGTDFLWRHRHHPPGQR